MKPAIVFGAALVGLVVAGAAAASTIPPPGPPGKPPPDDEPPPSDDNMVGLGDLESHDRDGRILTAIFKGLALPFDWRPVDCSRGEIQGTVFVSARPVTVPIRARIPEPSGPNGYGLFTPDGAEPYEPLLKAYAGGLYEGPCSVNVRHPMADAVAEFFDAYLPTTRIGDLAFLQADARLVPQNQIPNKRMARTHRMIAHHLAVERARAGRGGLVRDGGKDWATSNLVDAHHAINFGWHKQGATFKSPGGLPVLQGVSNWHDADHVDYSQVIHLVRGDMVVAGQKRQLVDVMRDPKLCALVSDEGPIKHPRHPMLTEVQAARRK